VFILSFEALLKSHVDRQLKTAVVESRISFMMQLHFRKSAVTTFAVMKQKVKVHELGTELGQDGSRYSCRWFWAYHEANRTAGRTNVYTLTGNTGKRCWFH
jgi:hypothetical protein